MAQRSKAVVWHKKRGKFVSSAVLNSPEGKAGSCRRNPPSRAPASGGGNDKREAFREMLARKIKQAARRAPPS